MTQGEEPFELAAVILDSAQEPAKLLLLRSERLEQSQPQPLVTLTPISRTVLGREARVVGKMRGDLRTPRGQLEPLIHLDGVDLECVLPRMEANGEPSARNEHINPRADGFEVEERPTREPLPQEFLKRATRHESARPLVDQVDPTEARTRGQEKSKGATRTPELEDDLANVDDVDPLDPSAEDRQELGDDPFSALGRDTHVKKERPASGNLGGP